MANKIIHEYWNDLVTNGQLLLLATVYGLILFLLCVLFVCLLTKSPWYNRTGWLGVKHQLIYLLTKTIVFDEKVACVTLFPHTCNTYSPFRKLHFDFGPDFSSNEAVIVIMKITTVESDPNMALLSNTTNMSRL